MLLETKTHRYLFISSMPGASEDIILRDSKCPYGYTMNRSFTEDNEFVLDHGMTLIKSDPRELLELVKQSPLYKGESYRIVELTLTAKLVEHGLLE